MGSTDETPGRLVDTRVGLSVGLQEGAGAGSKLGEDVGLEDGLCLFGPALASAVRGKEEKHHSLH